VVNRFGFSGLRVGWGGRPGRLGRWNDLDHGVSRGIEVDGDRLEAFELAEGVAEVALGGVDHALEAGEGAVAEGKGVAERGFGAEFVDGVHLEGKDLGFGDGEAAESPGGADQDIDEVALLGKIGTEALRVLVAQGVEMGGIFAWDDEGLGVDAGFQSIPAGAGLALGGAWACGGVASHLSSYLASWWHGGVWVKGV
jgi:hypothetical protein